MGALIILTGKFGRLTVLKRNGGGGAGEQAKWLCRCDCGKEATVRSASLRRGKTKSCGCWHDESCSIRAKTHAMSKTLIYGTWIRMKQRCLNQDSNDWKDYGGRGIQVCDRWTNSFENFYADMGIKPSNGHSLDRINNDGHYEPSNCRWATGVEQIGNRRLKRLEAFSDEEIRAEFNRRFTPCQKAK